MSASADTRSARGHRWGGRWRSSNRRAFTLIEVMAVMVVIGILVTLGYEGFRDAIDRAKEVRAIGDLKAIVASLEGREPLPSSLAAAGFPNMLDPWGRPYVYNKFAPTNGNAPPQGARKDRFLVPINSRYDLYSSGKDGGSVGPLTAKASRDDIIVANDGGFVGRASNY